MKKVFQLSVIICLCFTLILPNFQVFAYQSNEKTEKEITLDLSDKIVKEGGFLENASAMEMDAGTEFQLEGESVLKADVLNKVREEISLSICNVEQSCDLSKYEMSVETVLKLLVEVANENPSFFYVNYNDVQCTVEDGKVIEVKFAYEGTEEDVKAAINEYDEAINEIISVVSPEWSDLEKALYINDYLVSNCKYDTTYSKYDAYDIIVDKTGVCQAYAEAYMELAEKLGVSCEIVTSWELNHAWNMICINGKYYQVDATWNDPLSDRTGRVRHYYFLKSTNYFRSNEGGHNADDWSVSGGLDINKASDTTFDTYFWNKINTPFQFANGKWYTVPSTQDRITTYTCDGKQFMKAEDVILLNYERPSGYWLGYYGGLGIYGNCLYYNSATDIYAYDLDSKTSDVVYSLTEAQKNIGIIYGMNVRIDGKIDYALAQSPNKEEATYQTNAKSVTEINKKSYTIQFIGNGHTAGSMSTLKCKQDTYILLPENTYIRDGYDFAGWNTKADGSGTSYADNVAVVNLAKTQGATVKLYAQWKPIEYIIFYNLPEFTKNHSKNPSTYTVEDEVKLYAPTMEPGYVFEGWYIYPNMNTYITKIPKGCTGNISLTLDYDFCSYTILFDGNGSTSGSSKTLKDCLYGKEYKLPKNPYKRKGYTFTGWNTKANGKGKKYVDKAKVKNLTKTNYDTVTLYAQWKKTKYKITYVLGDGGKNNSKNPTSYYITTSTKILKNPTRKGYTFKGWYSDSKYKNKVTKIKKGSTGNKTFYAKWVANKYHIKFDGNGATSGKMNTLKSKSYGKTYILTANKFKRKGYTFVGWNTKADGSGKFYKNKASIKNLTSKNGKTVTLYAQWKKKK